MEPPRERQEVHPGTCWFCRRSVDADDVELVLRFAPFVICTACFHYRVGDMAHVYRAIIRDIDTEDEALRLRSLGPETDAEVE